MATFQLSKDLQDQLDKLDSNIQLAATINGSIPTNYAFVNSGSFQFRTEFASKANEFSIVLFTKQSDLNYENCYARGVITGIERLALLIDFWVNKRIEITKISKQFRELEWFKLFSFYNTNSDIEAAWIKIKNIQFNNLGFWKYQEWNDRYEIMLNAAKRYKKFENLFPLTSHYNLRFSIDKEIKQSWEFYYSIVPAFDKQKGNYCVEISLNHDEAKYFDDINTALDFYSEVLSKIKPTVWK